MRRVFKPGDIRKDGRTVRIPDVEFKIQEETDETSEEKKEPVLTPEVYEKIKEEVLKECTGEIGRKKLHAQQECGKMIHEAKKNAEKTVSEAKVEAECILSEAKTLSEQIRIQAAEDGRKAAITDKGDMLENLAHHISLSVEEIKALQEQFFEEYEKELKHLAVEITEKIIAQKIEDDDMLMYNVIKTAVKTVRDAKWVKAEVSSQLSGYIDSMEKELKDAGSNVEFVMSDTAQKDTCILNTSEGLVVATLSEQLKNLSEFMDKLDKGDNNEDLP